MFRNHQYNNPEMGEVNGSDMGCPQVYECPEERVCHRQINHFIKHVKPIHTRIINHHVYHHLCVPCYTCCEENVCCNVFDPCCK